MADRPVEEGTKKSRTMRPTRRTEELLGEPEPLVGLACARQVGQVSALASRAGIRPPRSGELPSRDVLRCASRTVPAEDARRLSAAGTILGVERFRHKLETARRVGERNHLLAAAAAGDRAEEKKKKESSDRR